MSQAQHLSEPARTAIRIYLLIAMFGAVISVPILGLLGWFAWEWTKQDWPRNWVGWTLYILFSLVLVLGPFVGRALFKRGRPVLAVTISGASVLVPTLILLGAIAG